jgi:hypothetical protein
LERAVILALGAGVGEVLEAPERTKRKSSSARPSSAWPM